MCEESKVERKLRLNREYKQRTYKFRRAVAFGYVGRECVWCGEKNIEVLELDHVVRADKAVEAHRFHMVSAKRFLDELPKLQTLCKDCHKYKTANERGEEKLWWKFFEPILVEGKVLMVHPKKLAQLEAWRDYKQGLASPPSDEEEYEDDIPF